MSFINPSKSFLHNHNHNHNHRYCAFNKKELENVVSLAEQQELSELFYKLQLIEAIIQRNEAQLESFIDEQHQWSSLSEEEKSLILSKPEVELRIEELEDLKKTIS